MTKFSHYMDVSFTVDSDNEDPFADAAAIRAALDDRLRSLMRASDEELLGSVDCYDTAEVE